MQKNARLRKVLDPNEPTLPGLGPFSEAQTVKLVMAELQQMCPERYSKFTLEVSYPESSRSKCDLCIGAAPHWDWAIEIKMLRLLGDNGLPNDNMDFAGEVPAA